MKIVYENDELYVVNKPYGMSSLDYLNELKIYLKNKNLILLNRLDVITSGLLLIGKNLKIKNKFIQLFKNKLIIKYYYLLVVSEKKLPLKFTINKPLKFNKKTFKSYISTSGKQSISHCYTIKQNKTKENLYKCEILIKTDSGRTHQIRAHLKNKNIYLLNDTKYCNKYKSINDVHLFESIIIGFPYKNQLIYILL